MAEDSLTYYNLNDPLVIFEGVDGAGKSTLRKRFVNATAERYATVDRLFASNWVYDLERGHVRKMRLWVVRMRALYTAIPVLVVHVERSAVSCSEASEFPVNALRETNRLFKVFYRITKCPVVIISNDGTIEDTLEALLECLKNYEST